MQIFAFFELTVIEQLFQNCIVVDCRFTDDKIGIFTDEGSGSFELNKYYLNKAHKVDWATGPL